MKIGSLVKYVGSAAMYRDRVGVVTQAYGFIDERIEGKGRDAPGLGQVHDGLHPMSLCELKVVNAPDVPIF